MTLTQLNAFTLVARLGSVTAAATALGVSEPAVSQALTALRQHFGDPLIVRGPSGMRLTPGGARLLGAATQMVALGAEAEAAVREARGAPEQLRVIATPAIAEFVAGPLLEAFTRRYPCALEVSTGVAATSEMGVLVANRLADVALGPQLAVTPVSQRAALDQRLDQRGDLVSEPIFRYRMVVVAAGRGRATAPGPATPHGRAGQAMWLVDPSGAEPDSEVGQLLRWLRVPDQRVRVFANQTAAWAAAADGAGVAPAPAHLVAHRLRRGELSVVDVPAPAASTWYATFPARDRRAPAAAALRSFLATPEAMRLMREPGAGVPPSRFRPPVYVTIWS
jgi:DNA-binding transcriptional LysR family regulator